MKGADLVLGFCHGDQREGTVRCVPSNLAAHLAVEPAADEGAGDAGEGQEVVSFAFVAPVEAAAAGEPGHGCSIVQRCLPNRWEVSMPLRAMRWVMPRSRNQRRRWE